MVLRKEDIELIEKLSKQAAGESAVSIEDIQLYHRILETSAWWKTPGQEKSDFTYLHYQINKQFIRKSRVTSTRWLVAASVSLLIIGACFWLLQFSSSVVFEVPVAEMETVWLPDSSKVVLNAESKLSYSPKEWDKNNRKVELSGIAYFEVKKGSQFVVQTSYGEVTVLGTSFNVKALQNDFIVECITGKVAVSGTDEKHTIELTPGFKVERDRQSQLLLPGKFDITRSKEWLSGTFNFKNERLTTVWEELERQYDVRILHDSDRSRFYTGTFSNKNMKRALDAICKPMGLTYQIDNENRLITIKE